MRVLVSIFCPTASAASASSAPVGESRIRRWGLIWLGIVALVTTVGTLGYVVFFGWSLGDGLYMTAITLTTVGYKEVRELDANHSGAADLLSAIELAVR